MTKRAFFAVKAVASIGLLVGLFYIADPSSVFDRLKSIDLLWFFAGWVLLLGQVALSTLKWRLILRADGYSESFLLLLRTYFIGGFLGLFLPTSFGGDIYRIGALRKRVQIVKGTASVLFDRLTGLFALVLMALVGMIIIAHSMAVTAAVIALAVLCTGAFVALTTEAAAGWLEGVGERKLFAFPVQLLKSLRTYRSHRRTVVTALLISVVFQFMHIVVSYFFALALGLDVLFVALVLIIPSAFLTEVLPISINGIGVRDAALVGLFTALGYPAGYGLSLGLVIIASRYLLGIVGGVLMMLASLDPQRPASAAEPP